MSRIARIVALLLPVLLVFVLVSVGGWRFHDGRVERVSDASTSAAPPAVTSRPEVAPADEVTFVHHLSPSVPWPVWAGLIVLCMLPAVGSVLAWSGSRRGRDTPFSASGGSP